MRVVLAGYNIDQTVIEQAKQQGVPKQRLTPEVLSAAYARISRDPRPIGELRKIALEQVEKTRESNKRIIFEMGHHSIAEHAVFNFDLVGISRLAIESIERFRLCSFTEKSQRYITLDNDFVIPEELTGGPFEPELLTLVSDQARIYEELCSLLRSRLKDAHPDLEEKKSGRRLLDGLAKEDARYATILATTGQLGLTVNARNLELMIRRMSASPIEEVREIGRRLYEAAVAVAPSLLLFTEPAKLDTQTPSQLEELFTSAAFDRDPEPSVAASSRRDEWGAVDLVHATEDADDRVAAALATSFGRWDYKAALARVRSLAPEVKRRIFEASMSKMEFYDTPLRHFEHVRLTFEVELSASAFAQLKRHRMMTLTPKPYDPSLALTVPPAVVEVGREKMLREHATRAEDLYKRIAEERPRVADYVLTNAHRRRVLVTANLRDMYHFSRLREDTHAQWDIRLIADKMRRAAQEVMPLGGMLLGGKAGYSEIYEKTFGRRPGAQPPKA